MGSAVQPTDHLYIFCIWLPSCFFASHSYFSNITLSLFLVQFLFRIQSLSYIGLILPICELTALDSTLYVHHCGSASCLWLWSCLVGSCWLLSCQRSGPVIISAERTEHCKSFPLASRRQVLLPYIQSSVHVWAAEEAKVWGRRQGSHHCYVRPPLSFLTVRQL